MCALVYMLSAQVPCLSIRLTSQRPTHSLTRSVQLSNVHFRYLNSLSLSLSVSSFPQVLLMFLVQWLPDKRSDSVTPSNWIAPSVAPRRQSSSGPRYSLYSTLLYFTLLLLSLSLLLSHFLLPYAFIAPSSLLQRQYLMSPPRSHSTLYI